MIRREPGTFRSESGSVANLQDDFANGTAYLAARTSGAQLIDALGLSPPANQRWSVLALSLLAYLSIFATDGAYGKFSKLYGGLVAPQEAQQTRGASTIPWVPFTALPTDETLITTLWDPAVDPLPPNQIPGVGAPLGMLPVTAVIQLPQPLPLNPGETPGVGLWLPPMLGGGSNPNSNSVSIQVAAGRYLLTFDDGL